MAVDVGCASPAGSSGADVEETVEIPQLQRLCRTLLFTACRYATTGAGDGRDSAVNCGGSAGWHSSTGLTF